VTAGILFWLLVGGRRGLQALDAAPCSLGVSRKQDRAKPLSEGALHESLEVR